MGESVRESVMDRPGTPGWSGPVATLLGAGATDLARPSPGRAEHRADLRKRKIPRFRLSATSLGSACGQRTRSHDMSNDTLALPGARPIPIGPPIAGGQHAPAGRFRSDPPTASSSPRRATTACRSWRRTAPSSRAPSKTMSGRTLVG